MPMVDLNLVLKNDSSPQSTAEALKEFWDKALFHPWQEVISRPGKALRGQLVDLGWLLAGGSELSKPKALSQISEVIETLHLGSLIIDDIEDNSEERRGRPAMHLMYGLPVALNLGNFLYFQAINLISHLEVSTDFKNQAVKQITQTLRDAHLGQALDVSTAIDKVERSKIPKLVETSIRLKSGALMRLSIQLGALLNPEFRNWEALDQFGESYGSCLQKLDDIENCSLSGNSKKHLEDLLLKRPTWIWSVFAQKATDTEWAFFNEAVQALPSKEKLEFFMKTTHLKKIAFDMAISDLSETLNLLKNKFELEDHSPSYKLASDLTEKLTRAY